VHYPPETITLLPKNTNPQKLIAENRDGQGNFKFTAVIYLQANGQRRYNTPNQTCYVDGMRLPITLQKCSQVLESRNKSGCVIFFHLSSSSSANVELHSLPTKAIVNYFMHRTTSLSLWYPLSTLLSAN